MNNLEVITLTKRCLKVAVIENKFWGDSYEPPFSMNKARHFSNLPGPNFIELLSTKIC